MCFATKSVNWVRIHQAAAQRNKTKEKVPHYHVLHEEPADVGNWVDHINFVDVSQFPVSDFLHTVLKWKLPRVQLQNLEWPKNKWKTFLKMQWPGPKREFLAIESAVIWRRNADNFTFIPDKISFVATARLSFSTICTSWKYTTPSNLLLNSCFKITTVNVPVE